MKHGEMLTVEERRNGRVFEPSGALPPLHYKSVEGG